MVCRVRTFCRSVTEARDAEVEHLQSPVAREEDVRGLDVAMDDRLRVRGGEHVEELVTDGENDPRRQTAPGALPEAIDGVTFEQLHDEEGRAVFGHVIVEDGDRAGVLHGVGDVPLAQKTGRDARADR